MSERSERALRKTRILAMDLNLTHSIRLARRRIVWGKTINAGQTCVAPDYMVVDEKWLDKVLGQLVKTVGEMFGKNQAESKDFGRVVSRRHCERLKNMLVEAENCPGVRVVCGGSALVDVEKNFFPTSVVVVDEKRHGHLKILQEVSERT